MRDFVRERFKELEQVVRGHVRQELEKRSFDMRRKFREDSFEEKNFYQLTEEEIQKMKEVVANLAQKLKASITLIYLNSDANFPFKKELDSWKQSLPNLHIIYHNSSLSGHLTKLPTTIYQLPIYYLAGPPKMVDSFERILLGIGVDELNIRYDRFDGYK